MRWWNLKLTTISYIIIIIDIIQFSSKVAREFGPCLAVTPQINLLA